MSNEPTTTVVAGDEPEFESYEDLVSAAAGEDPAAMAQLALAEVSADLGPIDGAPVIDPALLDVRDGTDAIARLQSSGDSLSATQRDAVERWWAELTSDDALVYRSADDPEYQQTHQDAIDSGLPVEIDPDEAEASASPEVTQPGGAEPAGLKGPATGGPQGLVGHAAPAMRQIDQDFTVAASRRALSYFTSLLGGVRVDMHVFVIGADDSRLQPNEYARATTTIEGTFFTGNAPGDPWDFEKSARRCNVHVANVESLAEDQPRFLSIVSHEVFHCWQRANALTLTGAIAAPEFYKEGAAMWAGEQFSRVGSSYGSEAMASFFGRSTYDTDVSTVDGYDAIGFWTQIAQLRGGAAGLWDKLPSINVVAARGEEATFAIAVSGVDDERVAHLASSAAGQPTWGADWDLTGVSVGDDQRSIESRRPGDRSEVSERQQKIFSYSINEADLAGNGPWWVIDVTTEGLINAHWDDDATFTVTTPGTRQFCTDGACECPGGATPASSAEPVPGESDSIQLALTGTASSGASVTITSATADDVCPPVAFEMADKATFVEDGEGTVRLFGFARSEVLRPGDSLQVIGGGPSVTILSIVVGAPGTQVDSLAEGEYGSLVVFGSLDAFDFLDRFERAD